MMTYSGFAPPDQVPLWHGAPQAERRYKSAETLLGEEVEMGAKLLLKQNAARKGRDDAGERASLRARAEIAWQQAWEESERAAFAIFADSAPGWTTPRTTSETSTASKPTPPPDVPRFATPEYGEKNGCMDVPYDYFCVVDFECTCDNVPTNVAHEIIEFPCVFLNARTLQVDFEFHRYVRPAEQPQLTRFCSELTGIDQATCDAAEPLDSVLWEFYAFCAGRNLVAREKRRACERTFVIATDGPWDVCKFLAPEAKRKGIRGLGSMWSSIVNVRSIFYQHFRMQRGGVAAMLQAVGLEFTGREHSGIDDARNIARLVTVLVQQRCDVRANLDTPLRVL